MRGSEPFATTSTRIRLPVTTMGTQVCRDPSTPGTGCPALGRPQEYQPFEHPRFQLPAVLVPLLFDDEHVLLKMLP